MSRIELDKNHDTAMLPFTFLWEKARRLLRFLRMETEYMKDHNFELQRNKLTID